MSPSFTPLVLSSTGEMGKATTGFFKRLASMLSEKKGILYSKAMGWLRCRLSFVLHATPSCASGEPGHHNISQSQSPSTFNLLKLNFTDLSIDSLSSERC